MQSRNVGWIYVNLGAPFTISEVRLNWETAYAVNYQIQVSYDSVNWTTIRVISGNQRKGVADFPGLSGAGLFVRIRCTQTSAGSDNYSLYDFNVYGTPITDLAENRPAYASSVESSSYAPSMAADDNSSTRWSSGQWMQNNEIGWIYVDLGAMFSISEVRLKWETAYAVDYQIQVSFDSVNWSTILTVAGNQSKGVADFPGLSGTGRYVRILSTQTSAGSDNYSLYDFNVFGTPAEPDPLGPAGSLTQVGSSTSATKTLNMATLAIGGTTKTQAPSLFANSTTVTTPALISAHTPATPAGKLPIRRTRTINASLASRLSGRGARKAATPRVGSISHLGQLLRRDRVGEHLSSRLAHRAVGSA
jgi:hypothetical protein